MCEICKEIGEVTSISNKFRYKAHMFPIWAKKKQANLQEDNENVFQAFVNRFNLPNV